MADSTSGDTPPPSRPSLLQYFVENRTESALWLTRMLTIVLTFLYLVPISSLSSSSVYQKALLSSAATSALRLHQRLPAFRLSREFFALLIVEDSAHYLLYAVVFISSYPVALALLPVCLFAFLHFSSQTIQMMEKTGQQRDSSVHVLLSRVVTQYQRSILQTVSLTEIMIFPCLVFALLAGVGSLITPFIYYRFLSLRYSSRRNPYTRQMFHELRLSSEQMVMRPQCPAFIRSAVLQMIQMIGRLSPPIQTNE